MRRHTDVWLSRGVQQKRQKIIALSMLDKDEVLSKSSDRIGSLSRFYRDYHGLSSLGGRSQTTFTRRGG